MKAIWKYPFKTDDKAEITIPVGARFLSLQIQNGVPCLWLLIDLDAPYSRILTLRIFGTGHSIAQDPTNHSTFLGTYQELDGRLVFHVFGDIERA